MYVTCNRIYVNPEFRDAFEARFKNRPNLVASMPGFVSFQLLRPDQDDAPYVVMTHWESEGHFRAWTESDAFKQGHSRSGSLPREAFTRQAQLEMFEVVQE